MTVLAKASSSYTDRPTGEFGGRQPESVSPRKKVLNLGYEGSESSTVLSQRLGGSVLEP
jgi:hypothetical protein